ncbi:right-handed parallel beta-helix repeat-containing protein [Halococcus qingdaonensis]|uniref:right-handed parallel beta-helix repeat-containing protein n=1 Tax=Halococcus qingdaonensis TaxID=224402 RepID=UPI00211668A0|nr:right-handed parallel beta-helix repeat-containing protein [Halococcus qingdaonensis]
MTDDTKRHRREVLKLGAAAGATGTVGLGRMAVGAGDTHTTPAALPDRDPPREYENYRTRRVPEDHDTIQAAVSAANPHDLVLVGPGRYTEEVRVLDTPNITIRGRDRNRVVLDGEGTRYNGIIALADGVVMENLTATGYAYNAFYWTGVDGYRGSYLTAVNNGDYGLYAFDSVNGRFEHSYAAGHPDSGFYIGQSNPSHARVENVVAERNGIGYSGTNAGGNLVLRNSVWRHNMGGIVPNTLDSEALAPQSAMRIENNEVYDNNNADAPAKAFGYAAFGTGINVAGGRDNEIVDNDVTGHVNFGIGAIPMIDANLWRPGGNRVHDNRVADSGRADLALGAPVRDGNRFANNDVSSSRPGSLTDDGMLGDLMTGVGDPWLTLSLGKQYLQAELGEYPRGDWRDGPDPPERKPMPNPERPPREAVGPRRG